MHQEVAGFWVSKIYKIFIFAAMRPSATFETVINQRGLWYFYKGGLRAAVCWNEILEILLMIHFIANTFFFSLNCIVTWYWLGEAEIDRDYEKFKIPHPLGISMKRPGSFSTMQGASIASVSHFIPEPHKLLVLTWLHKPHKTTLNAGPGAWLLVLGNLIWMLTPGLMSHVTLGQLIDFLIAQVSHV